MKKHIFAALLVVAMAAPASAQLLINEVDADQTGTDAAEFVELYNAGASPIDFSVTNHQVVFWNGSNDLAYLVTNLTSGVVSAGGYVIIGNAGVTGSVTADVEATFADNILQNGQDAVSLHTGTTIVVNDAATAAGLVDALVYDTADADDAGLLALFALDGTQVDENGNLASATESIQRVPNGAGGALMGGAFSVVGPPTPAGINVPVEISGFELE